MKKRIFKTEMNRIYAIRNSLSVNCKMNGTQVILNPLNKALIDEAIEALNRAANILDTIK